MGTGCRLALHGGFNFHPRDSDRSLVNGDTSGSLLWGSASKSTRARAVASVLVFGVFGLAGGIYLIMQADPVYGAFCLVLGPAAGMGDAFRVLGYRPPVARTNRPSPDGARGAPLRATGPDGRTSGPPGP
jgi:hypothetical protein